MFCNACGGQLNLAPCPHCEAVNDATASVCHACKGELVEANVERASGGSEHGGPDAGGIETRSDQSATQTAGSGGLVGRRCETLVGTDDAAGSLIERMAGSIWQTPANVLAGHGDHRTAKSTQPEKTRSEPAEFGFSSTLAAEPAELRGLTGHAVELPPPADEPAPQRATIGLERYDAVPLENAVVALQAAPRLRSRKAALFTRGPIAAAAGAAVLVAIGALLYGPSLGPVHPTAPAGSAVPTQPATPTEPAAPAEHTGSVQNESPAPIRSTEPAEQPAHAERESTTAAPVAEATGPAAAGGESATASKPVEPASRGTRVRSSVAGGAAATVSESAAACTDGVVALGLCASEPAQAQPTTRIRSSPDVAHQSAKDDATRGCNDAAAALGLCTQLTTRGKK